MNPCNFVSLLVLTCFISVTDIDGNRYNTVQIGEQLWMAENLRTSRYANGDLIPNITDQERWFNLETGAWVYYDNNSAFHDKYGKLYNWFAVADERGLCPGGWRIPDAGDWYKMKQYLGLEEDDIIYGNGGIFMYGQRINLAGKLMTADHGYWTGDNSVASNESGFSGIPGGVLSSRGFINMGRVGRWWSTSEPQKRIGGEISLIINDRTVYDRGAVSTRQHGHSVRCLR